MIITRKFYSLEEIAGYASAFGSSVVNFLIMALILFYFYLKAMNKLLTIGARKPEPEAPAVKICPFCQSEISINATRCPHCTSHIPEAEEEVQAEIAEV